MGFVATLPAHRFAFAPTLGVSKLPTVEALLWTLDKRLDLDFESTYVDFLRSIGQPECEEVRVCEFFGLTPSFCQPEHLGDPLAFQVFLSFFYTGLIKLSAVNDTSTAVF